MTLLRFASSAALFAALATSGSAQNITSAHSGTLHTFDGSVAIEGKQLEAKPGYFPEVKEANTLTTQKGRAEVLLTPGVFLRIGEGSAIKMLDNRLVSTRVEFLKGTAVLEQIDPMVNAKGNSVTLLFQDYEITLRKNGLVELFSDPASMKVYKGEADVVSVAGNNRSVVKEGRMVSFNAVLSTEKFDEKTGDDLLLWARDRSQSMSAANMASARGFGNAVGNSGFYGGYGSYGSGWYFNQAYNMFTFLPMAGTYWSPWGYGYYSPYTIYSVYYPSGGYIWTGGGKATGYTGTLLPRLGANGTVAASINRLNHGIPGGASPIHSLPTPPSSLNSAFRGNSSADFGNAGTRGAWNAGSANSGFGTSNSGGSFGASSSAGHVGMSSGGSMGGGASAGGVHSSGHGK